MVVLIILSKKSRKLTNNISVKEEKSNKSTFVHPEIDTI